MRGNKIFKFVFYDAIRGKLVIGYTILFMILGFCMFYLGQDVSKSLISLLNMMLLLVPLISIIIGTIHYYNSREFIEMLLSQPVKRSAIFWGEYLGVSVSLSGGFLIGLGVPLFIYRIDITGITILVTGTLLTFCFVAIAFLVSVINNDKAKGIGASILTWFYFSVLYDGLILFVLFLLNEYPLEKLVLILGTFNPIDIARIIVLLKMDISALMGVTGALFQQIFGNSNGMFIAVCILLLWVLLPVLLALMIFKRKDF